MADESAIWLTRRPSPPLAALIGRYVGYRMTGFPAGLHRGLPAKHLTLIVSIGPPIVVVSQTDARQAPRRTTSRSPRWKSSRWRCDGTDRSCSR